ncbi:uncharacterized protein LOC110723092 isoform X2 [Chenopodium quinoa]|uniref:uncharacterized protein LOC110723092 isoform X2 n=1 Tax=Chenopodium quinoa TaxID=63459 RepID=UPI000B796B40|nr:uncharacterized protein LOC110723092 isoform X2 [Chenopodium quinoa]
MISTSGKKSKTSVDWANLPSELLVEIIENYLVSVEDYEAVSGVCRSWRKAAIVGCDRERLRHNWRCRQMPWLFLTDGNEEILNKDGPYARLTNLEKRKRKSKRRRRRSVLNLSRFDKKYNVKFPQGYGRSCWGSSHGWILSHDDTRNMFLFNPLTNTRVNLPCETTLPMRRYFDNYFINRAAIFNDNTVEGALLVVLIYNRSKTIAFAKPGDTEWTEVKIYKVPTIVDVIVLLMDKVDFCL